MSHKVFTKKYNVNNEKQYLYIIEKKENFGTIISLIEV